MASVLVTVLVLGVFIPIVQATTGAANEVREKVLVDVYLKTRREAARTSSASGAPDERHAVRRQRRRTSPRRRRTRSEKKRNPEAYELLGSNPLPDTFRVTPDKPGNVEQAPRRAGAGRGQRASARSIDPAIDEVKNRRDETTKILSATRVVKLSMACSRSCWCSRRSCSISNTIRLSLFARRREVEVMKLVGATDWFIRWPFVIEGDHRRRDRRRAGDPAAAHRQDRVLDPLAQDFSLIAAPETINFALLVAVLLCASVAVVGRRLGPVAAPLPARLSGPRPALTSSLPCGRHAAPPPPRPPARPSCSRRSCSSWASGSAAHPEHLPGFVREHRRRRADAVVHDANDLIQDDYYHKVPSGKLSDAAIEGMVASLDDRFSNYFTPAEYKRFQEVTESRVLGRRPQRRRASTEGLRVTRVYDESPAPRAGLKRGDLSSRSTASR